jgi:glycosyltransferase involved in cell wall biosynthesis
LLPDIPILLLDDPRSNMDLLRTVSRILVFLRELDADILLWEHWYSEKSLLLCMGTAKLLGIRTALVDHYWPMAYKLERNQRSRKYLRQASRYPIVLDRFVRLVSPSFAPYEKSTLSTRLYTVGNGVDITYFRPSMELRSRFRHHLSLDGFVIGCCCRMAQEKRVDYLLDLLAVCSEIDPGTAYTLVIAGIGPLEEDIRAQAQKHRFKTRFLGPWKDMASFYCGIDLLCLTSELETDPLVIKEALACGREVVASRTSWLHAIPDIPNTLHIITGSNLQEDANTLISLLNDLSRERRLPFSPAARSLAQRDFDSDRLNREMFDWLSRDSCG